LVEKDKRKRSVSIGMDQWEGCTNSKGALDRLMSKWLRQVYKNRCDLLLISDLPKTHTKGVIGRPVINKVADAVKVINNWAKLAGAAAVAGIIVQGDRKTFMETLTEQISKYATIIDVNPEEK
jgi:hypothetical protein